MPFDLMSSLNPEERMEKIRNMVHESANAPRRKWQAPPDTTAADVMGGVGSMIGSVGRGVAGMAPMAPMKQMPGMPSIRPSLRPTIRPNIPSSVLAPPGTPPMPTASPPMALGPGPQKKTGPQKEPPPVASIPRPVNYLPLPDKPTQISPEASEAMERMKKVAAVKERQPQKSAAKRRMDDMQRIRDFVGRTWMEAIGSKEIYERTGTLPTPEFGGPYDMIMKIGPGDGPENYIDLRNPQEVSAFLEELEMTRSTVDPATVTTGEPVQEGYATAGHPQETIDTGTGAPAKVTDLGRSDQPRRK